MRPGYRSYRSSVFHPNPFSPYGSIKNKREKGGKDNRIKWEIGNFGNTGNLGAPKLPVTAAT